MSPARRVLVACALLSVASPAAAEPQVSVGLSPALALTDLRSSGPRAAFHLALRGDVLFGRSRRSDMGVGPYLEAATTAFDTAETGAGVAWLVPVGDVALVPSAGAIARRLPGFGWEPGVEASVFFGARGYNFHSAYGMAFGGFAQLRHGLGESRASEAVFGLRIDTVVLALPFVALVSAIRR